MADILLVNPPVFEPFQPPLGISALSGYLQSQGFSVDVWDISIDAFHHINSQSFLDDAITRIHNRVVASDEKSRRDFDKAKKIALALQPLVRENVHHAIRIFQDRQLFFQYPKYRCAQWVLRRVPEILYAAYFPTRIGNAKAFYATYQIDKKINVPNALAHISDAETNLFLEYFRNSVVPRVKRSNPAVIGVSISFYSQLLPSLTLCRLLREQVPGTPLILGGGFVTAIADLLEKEKFLWNFATGIVLHEGETALSEVCRRVKEGKDLNQIPNMFSREDPIRSREIHIEDIQKLPTPDYSKLPLGRYLVPEPTVPLLSNKGCYWGKCTFCSDMKQCRWLYRQMTIERFIQHVESLHASTGANVFDLCDLATPVPFMKDLARYIRSHKKPYTWFTMTRFEPQLDETTCQFLADGGCLFLFFGLESASKRVIQRMRKGTDLATIVRVLHACKQAGIHAFLSIIIGFPGETFKDAQITERFLLEHSDLFFACHLNMFQADEGSMVTLHPEQFRISLKERDEITSSYKYVTHEGMSPEEAEKQLYKISLNILISTNKLDWWSPIAFSSTRHQLLYKIRYGTEYFQMFETAQDLSKINLNDSLVTAPPDINVTPISDEESIVHRYRGPFLVVPNTVARAVDYIRNHAQPLSAALLQAFEGDINDKIDRELFYQHLLVLILLVKYDLLEWRAPHPEHF